MSTTEQIPTIVLGGSGYVAGEFLRLIAGHPGLTLGGVVSMSQAGEPVGKTFPHLAPTYPDTQFVSLDAALGKLNTAPHWLLLSAAPHGASAGLVDQLLKAAASAGVELVVVDASADFRFADAAAYEAVYGHAHQTPALLKEFTCAVPEQLKQIETPHAAHPGCFATTMLLGLVPLAALGLADEFFISAVTGSTGAGRTPRDTTHHPLRQSNLFAYQALKHRHDPEVRALIKAATGRDVRLSFVPHSGPFARGIHATVQAHLKSPRDAAAVIGMLREFYAGCPFVRVLDNAPRVKDIVTSNYAHLSAAANGRTVAVMSVVDNLNKGAAGGAVQWMNRLFTLPETAGLTAPAPGWT
jgi:N-acetyl-gamma-glutamyl-phosphate reductase common form